MTRDNDYLLGLLRIAVIQSYNPNRGEISVKLTLGGKLTQLSSVQKDIKVPFNFFSNDGLFIGGYPTPGTPIVIGQGEGGTWHFVSYYFNREIRQSAQGLSSTNLNAINIDPGTLFLRASKNTQLTLSKNDIVVGNSANNLTINTNLNILNFNFDSNFSFSQASRNIDGVVKRDISPLKDASNYSKLDSLSYENNLKSIGMDPKLKAVASEYFNSKNPPFTEKRELIYEFAFDSNINDDITESQLYSGTKQAPPQYNRPNRRLSKTDTLSLSLVSPNYLMETVKGTVVDIFGNILDINRARIPIGVDTLSLKNDQSNTNKSDIFLKIKEAERNSIAYHFELNARKNLINGKLPDVNSRSEYSKSRSRFSFDINKEGLFKLNVPASSSFGTVPLLVRYENYSTYGTEDNGNPNKFFIRDDRLDLFLDSFAYGGGTISVVNSDGYGTPIDRILNNHIKHGTVYHDILRTCSSFQTANTVNSQYNTTGLNFSNIPEYNSMVSNIIDMSSIEKNAGGRSASVNFDGSLELNVGANTVDKQSLWLDFQGGIVGNIGRDKQNLSAALSTTGDVLIEIGSTDVDVEDADSRFSSPTAQYSGRSFDIRVRNSGLQYTILRIDDSGLTVISPTRITLSSNKQISIKSSSDVNISGERVIIQGRTVRQIAESPVEI
jgi:hypothetical protein